MATFQNPIGAQSTSVPTVQAPVKNTAIADTINTATQLFGAYQASQPGPPSQSEVKEQRQTQGLQAAFEMGETYNYILENEGRIAANTYANREFRQRRIGMTASEYAAFEGAAKSQFGFALDDFEAEVITENEKSRAEQLNNFYESGVARLGPDAPDIYDEETIINFGWSYERTKARRQMEAEELSLIAARSNNQIAEQTQAINDVIPEAMTNLIYTIAGFQERINSAPEGERDQMLKDYVAQLRVMKSSASRYFQQYIPEGARAPEYARTEYENFIDSAMLIMTGESDQQVDSQSIINALDGAGSAFVANKDNSTYIPIAGITRAVGVDISRISQLDLTGTELPNPSLANRNIRILMGLPTGPATSSESNGVNNPSDSILADAYSISSRFIKGVSENPELAEWGTRNNSSIDLLDSASSSLVSAMMETYGGRRSTRQLAFGSGGFDNFIGSLNYPLSPELKNRNEDKFEEEGITPIEAWRGSFSNFVRDKLEPSLANQRSDLINSIQFRASDGRVRVSVNWDRNPNMATATDRARGERGGPAVANPRQMVSTDTIIRKTEREINKYIESYINATNGNREEIVQAMVSVLEARGLFVEKMESLER